MPSTVTEYGWSSWYFDKARMPPSDKNPFSSSNRSSKASSLSFGTSDKSNSSPSPLSSFGQNFLFFLRYCSNQVIRFLKSCSLFNTFLLIVDTAYKDVSPTMD